MLNVTLLYPQNERRPFLDLLCGRMQGIVVHVEILPISDEIRGDYFNNKDFKHQFQLWLNTLWQRKDLLITRLRERYRPTV